MLALIFLLAAAAYQPATEEPTETAAVAQPTAQEEENEEIIVRGQRPRCRHVNRDSAQSRIGGQRICLTQQEWSRRRDEAVEFYADLPRRNPAQAGRTVPTALEAAQPF